MMTISQLVSSNPRDHHKMSSSANSSLSQAYQGTNLHPKHIIPIDFGSTQDLPESHEWTQEDGFSSEECLGTGHESVPIIDLEGPDVVEHVGKACQTWGMFQVTNHQVSSSEVEAHSRRLFALPPEQKLKAVRSPNGASGYGMARLSPFYSKLMWHEGFTIMGSAEDHAKLLWPHQYQHFCDVMEEYENKMKPLAYKILVIMMKSLGVDEDNRETICSSFLNQSVGALQLNSYPRCPNPSQTIGLAPHTDSLLLTILHQNDTTGLQIFKENMGWISVPPVPNALVVNIGDLMHILSNACFPPVLHRVVLPNEMDHRFTVAYFYGPPADSVVEPFPELSIPHFRPVTVKEYIGLKEKHLDKALSLITI